MALSVSIISGIEFIGVGGEREAEGGLMPLRAKKCILMAQQRWQIAVCKSIFGYLWSSTWCFG